MRIFIMILALSVASFSSLTPLLDAEEPPAWAYPVNPLDFKPRAEDDILRRVPGSSATYSVTQLQDRFTAPVWHPGDHPTLPQIVATGRKPNVFACGFCHRADGSGGPENSNLAGLPAAYFVQQIADYKSGARKTSVPKSRPHCLNDIAIKRHHGRRSGGGSSLFFRVETEIEYQGCRNRRCSENVCRRMVSGRQQDRGEGAHRSAHNRSARRSRTIRKS